MEFINYTSYEKAEDIKRLKFIINHLPTLSTEKVKVLDIGCGNGNISYQLASYGYNVKGIDVDTNTITNAKRKYGHIITLDFEATDAEHIQISGDEKYDVIVCSEVIEHLHHPDALVRNFKRLLKRNGIVIVTVPNGFGPREVFVTKPSKKILSGKGWYTKLFRKFKSSLGYNSQNKQSNAANLDHIQFFSMKSLEKLAGRNGFTIIKRKAGNFMENIFPVSLLSKKIYSIQQIDCWLADHLPLFCTSAFYTVWKPK